jgi:biotin carboxylase
MDSMDTNKAEVAVFVGELPFNLKANIDAVSEYGLKKVRICDHEHAPNDDEFDKTYATDLWSEDALLATIAELQSQFQPKLVLTFAEISVVPAGFITERLGVGGHAFAVANRCRNKFLMRQAFSAAGMPGPGFQLIDSIDKLAEQESGVGGFPLICKPVLGFASQGVRRVDNAQELAQAIRHIKRENKYVMHRYYQLGNEDYRGKVLVESFIAGREIGVDGVVCNGEVSILLTIDKPDVSHGPYFGDSLHIAPADLADHEQDALLGSVEAAINAVGITHGPFHLEARIDQAGCVQVIELGARIGFPRLIKQSLGLDIIPIAQRAMLGKYQHRASTPLRYSGNYCINADRVGRYRCITNLAEMKKVPSVVDIPIFVEEGERVSPPPLGNKYIGFAIAAAASYQDVATALEYVKENLALGID